MLFLREEGFRQSGRSRYDCSLWNSRSNGLFRGCAEQLWMQIKALNNQTDSPVIFDITDPICARAPNFKVPFKLAARGHHDSPVMPTIRPEPVHNHF